MITVTLNTRGFLRGVSGAQEGTVTFSYENTGGMGSSKRVTGIYCDNKTAVTISYEDDDIKSVHQGEAADKVQVDIAH